MIRQHQFLILRHFHKALTLSASMKRSSRVATKVNDLLLDFASVFVLMLVLEGIMPFIAPRRHGVKRFAALFNLLTSVIRFVGLTSDADRPSPDASCELVVTNILLMLYRQRLHMSSDYVGRCLITFVPWLRICCMPPMLEYLESLLTGADRI